MHRSIPTIPRAKLAQRRFRNIALAVIATGLVAAWLISVQSNLGHAAFTSGYVLLGALGFLAAYNVRKIFPGLAWLGTSAQWMQLHIYVALGTFAVFLMHVGLQIPEGILERILAGLYLFVFFSGLVGLYWTRTIPRRLSAVRQQVIFEQIPQRRREIVHRARSLLFETTPASAVLGRFYLNHLSAFFERPRSLAYLVKPSGTTCRSLLSELEGLARYLSPSHREMSQQLADLVRGKDDLDYHLALQGRLRVWLFLHIGLTYSLLLVAVAHGIAAHLFHGGAV